jgi:hypothetical protein
MMFGAVTLLAAAGLAGAARAEVPAGFDARVEQVRKAVGVPGSPSRSSSTAR